MKWLRLYTELIDDPKVQRLPPPLFKLWVNLLCLAGKADGRLPGFADIGFALRISQDEAIEAVGALKARGLLEMLADGTLVPHNWQGRQFSSDDGSPRVQRYRERRQSAGLPRVADAGRYRAALVERDGEQCVYCGAGRPLVVEHMVPIRRGGSDDLDNLAFACKRCNSGKAGRTPAEAGMTFRVMTALEALHRYERTMADTSPDTTPDTVSGRNRHGPRYRGTEADSEADRDPVPDQINPFFLDLDNRAPARVETAQAREKKEKNQSGGHDGDARGRLEADPNLTPKETWSAQELAHAAGFGLSPLRPLSGPALDAPP